MKIILDTNMLLVPGQDKVDIFSELERIIDEPFEIIVPVGVVVELDRLARGTGDDARAARLGKMLLEHQKSKTPVGKCKALRIEGGSAEEHVDDAILSIADDDALVATNDGSLKRRLLENGVRVISLRQHQYLALS